jgi:hypothetical protein
VIRFGDVAHVYTVTMRHMQNSQRMYLEEHASQSPSFSEIECRRMRPLTYDPGGLIK